jgi:hypothetical protein
VTARFAIALVCLLAAFPARADDPAVERYRAARELYEAGKADEALHAFETLLAETKSPNARLYVARCLRELGRKVDAYVAMKLTVEEATARANEDAKYEGTRDAAGAELLQLEQMIGRVVVALAIAPTSTEVTVNDRRLAQDELGQVLPVAAGEVKVMARARGFKDASRSVQVAPGALVTVALELEPAAASPSPKDGDEVASDEGGIGAVRAAGIGVLVVGVGGLVAMGVTGAMAQSKHDELDEKCGGARCTDPETASLVDDGETLALVSNVCLGVGAAATVAGVAMIIFGGPSDDSAATALSVGPTGASLRVRW